MHWSIQEWYQIVLRNTIQQTGSAMVRRMAKEKTAWQRTLSNRFQKSINPVLLSGTQSRSFQYTSSDWRAIPGGIVSLFPVADIVEVAVDVKLPHQPRHRLLLRADLLNMARFKIAAEPAQKVPGSLA